MKGFEPISWKNNLPGGGPPTRSYDDAVEAWHACWAKQLPAEMISNLRDCRVVESAQPPGTQTDSPVIRQAWICSPWTAFGLYGFDEADKIQSFWSKIGAKSGALASSAILSAAAPDRCRQVRSFLFSTPIHPEPQNGERLAGEMQSISESANLPVLCRGLAAAWRADEIREGKDGGLLAIPTRAVWLFDGTNPTYLERHNTRMDLTLARKSAPMRLVDPACVEPWVWQRFADLYGQLYLEKHNALNPAYTARFMEAAARSGLLEFLAFQPSTKEGIEAFVGLFNGEGQSTCPLVGVDILREKEWGLYRMCCALCFGLAATRAQKLNFSSGAGRFKRLRGGEQSLEYALLALPKSAVIKRKFWTAVGSAIERWAAPILVKEGL